MVDYDISRASGKCAISGRPFEEGEEFYTVVLEGDGGFERRDYALEAWQGPPEGTLCHFKTRMPRKNAPKKTFVDNEVLIGFFLRLAGAEEADDVKLRFRFVLSLILLRKRLLKYECTVREAGREYWEMRLMRDKSRHRVLNPALDEAEIEALSGELSAILHGHAAQDAETLDPSAHGDNGLSPAAPPEPAASVAPPEPAAPIEESPAGADAEGESR
ncbi:MAG: hypothetical protein ACE5E1_11145 [Phycisphaerae bacterium]